ncbi:MAG: hypothetical protein IPO18_17165 [bacterium]|nr:hypothetical protein [bacterium]
MPRPRLFRLLIALGILAVGGWFLRGYTTDDTFIHLRYAQNLLERGEVSFNPGEPTYGATSPLWIFGLALLLKLGLAPTVAAWALGALCGLGVILVADAILSRFTYPETWKAIVLAVIAADPWLLRWTYSGMETPLATLALLVLVWPLVSGRDLGWGVTREPLWRRYLGWGVAAGLAGLVRPEFLLLAPAVLPILLWFEYYRASAVGGVGARHRARPTEPAIAALAGWLLAAGPWLLYAWAVFGRALPDTASAKSGALLGDPLALIRNLWQASSPLLGVIGFFALIPVLLVILVLARQRDPRELDDEDDDGVVDHDSGVVLVETTPDPTTPAARDAAAWSVWGPVAFVGVAVTWAVMLLGGYAVRQVWVISRYVSPLAPVAVLALSLLVEWLLHGPGLSRGVRRFGHGLALTCVAAGLGVNVWIFGSQVVPHAQAFPRGVSECYGGIAGWLRQNTAPGQTVAALDIGAIGFHSERRVLDLMGLVSPAVRELGRQQGFEAMVAKGAWLRAEPAHPPVCLVDRTDGPPRWTDRVVEGFRFDLVSTCALPGVGLREKQPWTVALYRLVPVPTVASPPAGG